MGEFEMLRSQFVTSNVKGGKRYLPYVFTEPGVAMLASVIEVKLLLELLKGQEKLRKCE